MGQEFTFTYLVAFSSSLCCILSVFQDMQQFFLSSDSTWYTIKSETLLNLRSYPVNIIACCHFMCAYMHTCIHIHGCIHIQIYTHIYGGIYISLCICVYIYIYMYIQRVCECMCISLYIYLLYLCIVTGTLYFWIKELAFYLFTEQPLPHWFLML